MTFNIVAQFASSVWKNSEAERAEELGFSVGDFKEYPVVSGSVFNEEYNETLDSASLVLSQIQLNDRLSNLKPYEYVRVYDKTLQTGFDQLYLIDNFNETENNIKDRIFGYTINLMSETKWLEKIQCPNLTITHEVDSNGRIYKKTIFEHIKNYMELYIPKVKFDNGNGTWSYKPLINFGGYIDYSDELVSQNITDQDFHAQGDEFEAEFYTNAIPSNVDLDTVSFQPYQVVANPDNPEATILPFQTFTYTFDETTRKFHIICSIRMPNPGDLLPQTLDFIVHFPYTYYTINPKWQKFDIPCADMAFTVPTLRQLLTTLMLQVGCIPIIKNRTLGYLDFQLDAVPFGGGTDYKIGNTVNYITRGLSSDSYANTLVNISENVLDSGNKVVCEALGFRDKDSALLKQKENLYLDTKFPIYKVEKFVINSYVKADVSIYNINDDPGDIGTGSYVARWQITSSKTNENLQLDFNVTFNYDINTILEIVGEVVVFDFNEQPITYRVSRIINGWDYTPGVDDVFNITTEASYRKYYFNGTLTVFDRNYYYQEISKPVFYCNYTQGATSTLTLYSQGITSLLLENSIRQNLSTDFTAMIAQTTGGIGTLQTLAQYIYGTIGYSIGSTRISGFSDTYSVGSQTVTGWIDSDYTYIENIWTFLVTNYRDSIINHILGQYGNMPHVNDPNGAPHTDNIVVSNITPYNPQKRSATGLTIFSSNLNFAYMWFDIEYQPLNTFNLAYTKSIEDVDVPIAQYDGNASGLTDFDRLSLHEQEQVDRIGNEVLTINQRTPLFSQIQTFENGPLLFRDSVSNVNYIVFKRTFTVNNNCFNASYTASKDAILKNYFTSIRTKYRAYQYVDYSQSVLRKERETLFVKLTEDGGWYDGDDKIFFKEFTSYNLGRQRSYLSKLLGSWQYNATGSPYRDSSRQNAIKYCVLSDGNQQTRNDLSVVVHKNFFAAISEEMDNVGSGTFISNASFDQAYSNRNILNGGVPQTWQIWQEGYNTSHIISFIDNLNINDIFEDYVVINSSTVSEVKQDMDRILYLPVLDAVFVDLFSQNINNVSFSVVKNNKGIDPEDYSKVFYKDYSERLSYTVQFTYYTDSENILWSEGFFKTNDISGLASVSGIILMDLTDSDFEVNDGEYKMTASEREEQEIVTSYTDIVVFNDGLSDHTNPYIQINWERIPEITQFKVIINLGFGTYNDVLAFKKGESNIQKFYVTLNDTKTDYVLSEQNGILYRKYKVATNTSERNVAPLEE